MLSDLVRAILAAFLVGVLPGWFWASCLCAAADRAERLAYSVAFSVTLVPVIALALARLFETGVTLAVAVVSGLLVLGLGLIVHRRFGPAKGVDRPLLSPPAPPGYPTHLTLVAASVMTLLAMVGVVPGWRVAPLIALLLLVGGLVYLLMEVRPEGSSGPSPTEHMLGCSEARSVQAVRWSLILAMLLVVLLRGYLGPLQYDWPFPRGVDRYGHAVMVDMMLEKGTTDSFMLYPPGFHVLAALVSRLSGLEPLDLFAVLAPAMLVLPAVACYALGRRLWGWEVGVVAALFSGLVVGGTFEHADHARYANLIGGHFLLVLALAALFRLYSFSSRRDGLTLALLGSSVVFYHQVASLYEAALISLLAVLFLPYLLARERRLGLAILSSFTLLGALSVLYAWDTYDLGRLILGLLGGGEETGRGGEAVSMALGTKAPSPPEQLLHTISQPALWLGSLGALFLLADRASRTSGIPDALSRATLLFWALLMFVGSRTALSSFPDRFERDLSLPISLLAALAFVAVLRSCLGGRGLAMIVAPSLAVLLIVTMVALQVAYNLEAANAPAKRDEDRAPPPAVAAAGEWLREHNDGGNILSTPYVGPTSSRGMLAMGGYSAMQGYTEKRIEKARDLPPFGAGPLWDVLWVVKHPEGERTRRVLAEHDVRYVVLYKRYPGVDWRAFREREELYRTVFENGVVIILEPSEAWG